MNQVGHIRPDGHLGAIAIFGGFAGEAGSAVPAWAEGFFDPERPGSFSHFYDEMSLGQLRVRGEVAPGWYGAAGTPATRQRKTRQLRFETRR